MFNNSHSQYHQWLITEIQIYEAYHNHKETMAWVSTAFYIPLITAFGYYGGQIIGGWATGILVFLILLIVCLIFIFVNMQFRMRWLSDNITIKLRQQINQIHLNNRVEYISDWGEFIKKERILAINERRRDFIKTLNKIAHGHFSKVEDKWKTELPSYFFILIATIIGVVLLHI